MNEIINNHFDLTEMDVEAQALTENVVANAATSEENVPVGEGQVEIQASMSASGMREKDLKQYEVRAADCEARSSILAECTKLGAVKQEHFTVSLSDLLAMGFIIATFVMNREVNEKHVKKLMKDVRIQGKNAFSQYVTVCSAFSALLMGHDIMGLDGELVTLETQNLDKILVIIDGQHRVAACLGTLLDIDCDVMVVPCPVDIAQDIKDRNCCDKNWDTTALRHQIVEVEKNRTSWLSMRSALRRFIPDAVTSSTQPFSVAAKKMLSAALKSHAVNSLPVMSRRQRWAWSFSAPFASLIPTATRTTA